MWLSLSLAIVTGPSVNSRISGCHYDPRACAQFAPLSSGPSAAGIIPRLLRGIRKRGGKGADVCYTSHERWALSDGGVRSMARPEPWTNTSSSQSEHGAFLQARRAGPQWRHVAVLGAIAGTLALGLAHHGADVGRAAAVSPKAGSIAGQFLVATDELHDPRFVRTVVYMIQHDARGAMGLVVNRPMGGIPLADLLDRLGLEGKGVNGEIRVHYGGPVEPSRGFVLHTNDYVTQSTEVVKDGIAVTFQPEILRAIGAGAGPRRTLLALGYAGWAPGQLEAELEAGAWVLVPADEALLFDDNYEKKWARAMARRVIQL